jgi:hypothetical protein
MKKWDLVLLHFENQQNFERIMHCACSATQFARLFTCCNDLERVVHHWVFSRAEFVLPAG